MNDGVMKYTHPALCALDDMRGIAMLRANAKRLTLIEGRWNKLGVRAVPIMKIIGPIFGKDVKLVKEAIECANGSALREILMSDGMVILDHRGKSFEVLPEYVRFEDVVPDGWFKAEMSEGVAIYVDCNVTPELEEEGYSREIVRRIQEMRKEMKLAVADKIRVNVILSDRGLALRLASNGWMEIVGREVRADALDLIFVHHPGTWDVTKIWKIEGPTGEMLTADIAMSRIPI